MVRLLQEGACRLEEMGSYSAEELQRLLRRCDVPFGADASKVSVGATVETGVGRPLVVPFLGRDLSTWRLGVRVGQSAGSQTSGQLLW